MSQKVGITHKSRYAPIRYEATRPYAQRFGKLFMAEARKGKANRLAFLKQTLFPLIQSEVCRMGRPEGPGPIQGELQNIQVYGGYHDSGRLIYDVRKELGKSLLVTDCKDVPCEAVSFPARTFYLHFGVETGLSEHGMVIEGAFVQHLVEENTVLIDLVPSGTFAVKSFWSLPMGEQLTGVTINLSNPTQSVMDALDQSLNEIMQQNEAMLQQIAAMEKQLSIQYGQPVKVPSPVENLANKRDLLHQALQLVINTLFFLSAEPDDIQEDWEESVPAEQISALSALKFGTRTTAENNLINQGYSKVKFVGRHYSETSEAKAISALMVSGSKSMPTHLRRGHFRAQPYGPERALRKTIFIAPIVVNAGKNEPAGRIYEV